MEATRFKVNFDFSEEETKKILREAGIDSETGSPIMETKEETKLPVHKYEQEVKKTFTLHAYTNFKLRQIAQELSDLDDIYQERMSKIGTSLLGVIKAQKAIFAFPLTPKEEDNCCKGGKEECTTCPL